MKVEIKNIKIAESLSEETTAFTADIFVDGKKVGYARNDGRGGCTDWNRYPGDGNLETLKKADEFCQTLPPRKFPAMFGSEAFEVKMNLEEFIDQVIDNKLAEKDKNKLDKQMVNSILWGIPGAASYKKVTFSKALDKIVTLQLQTYVNKYKKQFEPGEQFLNTNLEQLGIKI